MGQRSGEGRQSVQNIFIKINIYLQKVFDENWRIFSFLPKISATFI